VQDTVDVLMKKHYIIEKGGFSSRVTKYQHRFCNSEFGALQFSEQELGIVCVLLLRGPQTPGELRTRTERLCKFQDTGEVESTLVQFMQRDDGPFVTKLPREPGRRDSRFAHLFGGEIEIHETAAPEDAVSTGPGTEADRVEQLEQLVKQLRDEMATLKARLDLISPDEDPGSMS
jgi:uncharacterized protein YceH (UPF0502 family)